MDAAAKQDSVSPSFLSRNELHRAIRHRAEEIYQRTGNIPGRDVQNWIQAEAEIRREYRERSEARAAVVVNLEGVRYVGEYLLASAEGYRPGEFASGDSVPVRIDGDKMYVKRPNGKELETRIVSRVAGKAG